MTRRPWIRHGADRLADQVGEPSGGADDLTAVLATPDRPAHADQAVRLDTEHGGDLRIARVAREHLVGDKRVAAAVSGVETGEVAQGECAHQ